MINTPPNPKRYVTSWKEFRFLPGSLSALRELRGAGRTVIIVSNQAGVGRRLFTRARLQEITRKMLREIEAAGGRVQAVYYCTHLPERGCLCRKPRPGLLRRAARRFSLDLKKSVVIGDNATDIAMGKEAGCRTVLVFSGVTRRSQAQRMDPRPDSTAHDLKAAVRRELAAQ